MIVGVGRHLVLEGKLLRLQVIARLSSSRPGGPCADTGAKDVELGGHRRDGGLVVLEELCRRPRRGQIDPKSDQRPALASMIPLTWISRTIPAPYIVGKNRCPAAFANLK